MGRATSTKEICRSLRNSHGSCNLQKKDCVHCFGIFWNSDGSCNLHKQDCVDTRSFRKNKTGIRDTPGIHMDLETCTRKATRTPWESTWIAYPPQRGSRGNPRNSHDCYNLPKGMAGISKEFAWIMLPAQRGLRGYPTNSHG
jgi:hypothetical protein